MAAQFWLFLFVSIALPLALAEFTEWCPWLAKKLTLWAAGRLDNAIETERYAKEWLADVNAVPGKISKIFRALGYIAYLPRMRPHIRSRPAGQNADDPKVDNPLDQEQSDVMPIADVIQIGWSYTRNELHSLFGGSRYSGISTSASSNVIQLFSDPSLAEMNGFLEGLSESSDEYGSVYYFTGDGRIGDQVFRNGNRAILNHVQDGREIRIFTADGRAPGTSQKIYRYLGKFEVDRASPYFVKNAPDVEGKTRKVFVFRLRPANSR